MTKSVVFLAAAAFGLSACGVKGAPAPAAPLWGVPDREPPAELESPRSNVEDINPADVEQLVDEPEFLQGDDADEAPGDE